MFKNRFIYSVLRPLSILLILIGVSTAVAPAQPFVPVIMGKDARLTDDQIAQALASIERLDPHPQQIVVLIHGWDDTRKQSAARYNKATPLVEQAFANCGQRVIVVGLQWPSSAGPAAAYLPIFAAHNLASLIGLGGVIKDPYGSCYALARRIGFGGARQLLLALQDRFPQAGLHVFSHSMGTLIAMNAIRPDPAYVHDPFPRFEPQRALHLGLVCLAASDMDADVFVKDPGLTDDMNRLPRLLWITIPGLFSKPDNVLGFHHVLRFKTALGNDGVRLTGLQLDRFIGGMRMLFDEDTPKHTFLGTFAPPLLDRLARAAVDLTTSSHLSADLSQMHDVMREPDTMAALRPWLDSDRLQNRIVALWRLERLIEGRATYLENGYLFKFAHLLEHDPHAAERRVAKSPCLLVRDHIFPSATMWANAWSHSLAASPPTESEPVGAEAEP